MNLGRLDVCLSVRSVAESATFYEGLGFARIEGEIAEGWAIVAHGDCRIGLFEPKYMDGHSFSMNFRGAHIGELAQLAQRIGLQLMHFKLSGPDGSGSAALLDPDGNLLFFDSSPSERLQ